MSKSTLQKLPNEFCLSAINGRQFVATKLKNGWFRVVESSWPFAGQKHYTKERMWSLISTGVMIPDFMEDREEAVSAIGLEDII